MKVHFTVVEDRGGIIMKAKANGDPKPIIRIKTRISPFDDGTCRTCYRNHRPIVVKLENGEYITTTPASAHSNNSSKNRKDKSIADLFWPSDGQDFADTTEHKTSSNSEES
jgi:hypothetical protein